MSEVRVRQAHFQYKERWFGAYNYCLKHFDYEAAELVVLRNMVSDECSDGDHDGCFFSWCTCDHHSAVQFKVEHPELQSLTRSQSTRDEQEEAA